MQHPNTNVIAPQRPREFTNARTRFTANKLLQGASRI